jgi:hypothetical protein
MNKGEFNQDFINRLERQEAQIKLFNNLFIGVVVVLAVGFIGLLITVLISIGGNIQAGLAEKSTSYQSLVDKINDQNNKIDTLIKYQNQCWGTK